MSERALLIATKLNESSDQVVAAGIALARALEVPIRLLHVYKLPVLGDSQAVPNEDTFEAVEVGLRESLKEQANRLGIREGELQAIDLECGPVCDILERQARQLDVMLSVVGGEPDWTLARKSPHILRHAHRPVFVVRTDLMLPLQKVLAPVDLSPLSADAFRCGLHLLERLGGEPELDALFVMNPLERVGSMHFSPQQIDRFASDEMERFLKRNGGAREGLGSRILQGQPRNVILKQAETWPADLIVMGTHGRTGFERMVLGSVAEEIVRRSPCNLLVIPPDAALRSAISDEQPGARRGQPMRALAGGADRQA